MESYEKVVGQHSVVMYWDTEKREVQSLRWMNEEQLNSEEIDECDDEEELAGGYSFMIGKLLRIEATQWAVPMFDRLWHGKPEYLAVLIDNCNGVDLQLLDITQACSPTLEFYIPAPLTVELSEGCRIYKNTVGDVVILISLEDKECK
mgnify:CR=1 FL=1